MRHDFATLVELLERFPERLQQSILRFDRNSQTKRPSGTGFSVIEHVCHLLDFNEIYLQRFKCVASRSLPYIESVDGTALAAEHHYRRQRLQPALRAFAFGRKRLSDYLHRLDRRKRSRCGVRDGKQRMSLEELVREAVDHDDTHAIELDELFGELNHV